MTRAALLAALLLTGCTASEPAPQVATQVAARPDPDGFLYFNDAALYVSAMRRCSHLLDGYESPVADAEAGFRQASERYAALGGDPNRADLARIYRRSDRELGAAMRAQTPAERAAGCASLAAYHRRNVAAYRVAG